jgi:hypothetical protein
VRVSEFTPTVLRFQDGECLTANLEVISSTGGLLSLGRAVGRGSRVKLMFLSEKGPVLGTAEMLRPVSRGRQAFRFLVLSYADQRKLQLATESVQMEAPAQAVENTMNVNGEEEWIEKFRAASSQHNHPRRLLKILLGAGMLITLSLGFAVYLFSLQFVK